ncbi:hypothetical protein RJ639_004710 [Escallonia herrerae]|uniref:Chromo domain-containing protein n=1 Tax=Escallonia herrerae TaxID=1293975 RepID=A0AA88VZI7_9ASTE|nr:hypothetical protein RJ639_004710 [Escallonia herrerae]
MEAEYRSNSLLPWKAARRMKKHADKNRRSQEFNVGDKVMVKLLPQDHKFLRGRDSRLLQKYEGPLTIVKKIGKMAYKVDLPHWWSRQLHPVFHASMLKPFYEDTADPSRGQIKRQGLKPKATRKRVAEAILNDRVITAFHKRHQEYLVKWQGHMDEENTWEQAADLSAYADKIEAYHMQKLTRASTALVGENVTGCPLHPPSTVPPRPSSSAPLRPSNMHPCALASETMGEEWDIRGLYESLRLTDVRKLDRVFSVKQWVKNGILEILLIRFIIPIIIRTTERLLITINLFEVIIMDRLPITTHHSSPH